MTKCFHDWQLTTSDQYQQCAKCHLVCKVKYGTRIQIVRPTEKRQRRWQEAEYEMLNQAYAVDYVDHEKARTDLKHYWQ
jgi:uncharacterized phage-like protein YoqJ